MRSILSALTMGVLLLFTSAGLSLAQAPLTQPRVSQAAEVEQTVGLTEIEVSYHRPSVNNRTIWGGVVPYDQVWRAGANENTTISFSTPVTVNGKLVEAGVYGFHVIPSQGSWTVILSENADLWGSFNYDQAEDAVRLSVTPRPIEHQEVLQFSFPNVTAESALLELRWEKVAVPLTIEVDVHEVVLANFRKELRALSGFFPQNWGTAASYAARNQVAQEEALEWVDRALQQQRNLNHLGTKALLLEQLGREDEAAALIEEGLANATENQINGYGYQLLFSGYQDKAVEIFRYNVETHPDSWNVYDSLAEGLAAQGETEQAIEFYQEALDRVASDDEANKSRIEQILADLKAD